MKTSLGEFRERRSVAALVVLLALGGCSSNEDESAALPSADPRANTTPSGSDPSPIGIGTAGNGDSRATPAAEPLEYVPDNAFALFVLRPKRIFASAVVKGFPEITRQRAIRDVTWPSGSFGLDLQKVEYVTGAVVPPPEPTNDEVREPAPVLILRSAEPIDPEKVIERAARQGATMVPKAHNGIRYWRSSFAPPGELDDPERTDVIAFPSENVLIRGNEVQVTGILDGVKPGSLRRRLETVPLDQDLVIAMIPEAVPDVVRRMGPDVRRDLPAPLAEMLLTSLADVRSFVLTADLTGSTLLSLTVEGTSDEAAARLETTARGGRETLEAIYRQMTRMFRDDAAPADFREATAFADKLLEGLTLERKENVIEAAVPNPGGWDKLMAALRPRLQEAHEFADTMEKSAEQLHRMRQIALALHGYHDANKSFPLPKDAKGRGLSWRVHLLPYLEQEPLYQEFHLDEPWDSAHNKPLIAKMPEIFGSADALEEGKTRIVGFAGKGAAFGGEEGLKIGNVVDGASNTILFVEAAPDKAVIWTKPEDLEFDADNPVPALGELSGKRFLAAFMDGRVVALPKALTAEELKSIVTTNGNEDVDVLKLMRKTP